MSQIEGNNESLISLPSFVPQNVSLNGHRIDGSMCKDRLVSSQINQPPVQIQNRLARLAQTLHIHAHVVGAQRQPWLSGSKACKTRAIPRHRSSLRIAPQSQPRLIFLSRVLNLLGGNGNILHPNFLPVINGRRAAQSKQQHCRNPCLGRTNFRRYPLLVVISQDPVRPSPVRQGRFVLFHDLSDTRRIPSSLKELKVER